ncbi:hypothetical protein CR532_02785 [Candidatus Borreliella tachyglossi]|uniref:Uncharacterized protein n=1 Tax=Candidatus Borreliella tachyglossi TaxID=1964448 RepID=A0A2S1LX97_9SPIR|nr:hypothetical protein [Candidatus Borreliella tachyglossi]AWG42901.1 hypothetical protein CR532_02785 [Candidatus Borreliella tachyglossi]
MNRYFFIILIFFIHGFIFGIDLESIDFYRSLEKKELIFVIHLLEREKYFSSNSKLLTYIGLAKEALAERNIRVLEGDNKLGDMPKQLKNYKDSKLVLSASRALNMLVYCDVSDGFLKTLDGRNVGIQDGNFVILGSEPINRYYDVSNEYTTVEIYKTSILNPDFSKFILDKSGSFVYIGEFNKKVYLDDVSNLSREELLFLFYELFPISKLKGVKDWYDFGFLSILKEVKKTYNIAINSRRIK